MTNTILQYSITILSLVAAILAWVSKLKWSKEYSRAKDEIIRLKDAEIEQLKELNPIKIREYFQSVKTQLEEYNDRLQCQLAIAEERIEELESQKPVDPVQIEVDVIKGKNEERDGADLRFSVAPEENKNLEIKRTKKTISDSLEIITKILNIIS